MRTKLLRLKSIAIVAVLLASACSRPPQAPPQKKVIVVLPLTGAGASWGEHFKRGVDMFLQTQPHTNIQVQVIDSQTNPAQAQSAVRQAALGAKPYALVSTLSGITVPLKSWAKDEGVFLVACVITDKVLDGGGGVQRVYPSVNDNAKPLAEYATARYKRVGVLFSNDELGVAVRKAFDKLYVSPGHDVVLEEGYGLKDTEVRSTVAKFVKAKPEAVLVTGIGPAFWAIIREFHAQNFQGQILSDASFADPVQIEQLGPAGEGVIFTGSETELSKPRTASAQEFNADFKKRFGVPVNYTGVTVYESLRALDRLATSTPSLKADSFTALGELAGVPGTIRFLPGGDSQYPWFLMQRRQSEIVQAENKLP